MTILKKLTLIIGLFFLNALLIHAEDASAPAPTEKPCETACEKPCETSCADSCEKPCENTCADSEKSAAKIMEEKTACAESCKNNIHYGENVVNMAVESWNLFSVGHKLDYHVAPQMISVTWQLDDVGLEDWRRGNTAWTFSALYSNVFSGAETHMIGTCWGPRYNFVQPGWKFVPYVESRVGILFTDSTNIRYAQGQDFCFQFMVSVGTRYDFDENWSLQLSANYQHVSNGGLSEPERPNYGLDVIGPGVSMLYTF